MSEVPTAPFDHRDLPIRPRGADAFDAFYDGTPPWEIGRPQPALLRLAESGELRGRVLDVGCGTGEHALMAASLGLAATGVDASPKAIARALEKARTRGIDARFFVGDAMTLPEHSERYVTVLDSGVFHVFDDEDRLRYRDSLHAVIEPGGRYFVLVFRDEQEGDWGPRRVSRAEIEACFTAGWVVESVEPTTMDLVAFGGHALAWLASIVRR